MENTHRNKNVSRRGFIRDSSLLATAAFGLATTRTGLAAQTTGDRLKIGVIGCGKRGLHDATNCINADANIEIAVLGDLFADRLASFRKVFAERAGERLTATDETCFVGWDAYQRVIEADVDLVILTTPPHFRPAHLRAAIEGGRHVFTEKPVAVDPVGVRSVIATGELAEQRGLTIVAGTQMRRLEHLIQGIRRIHDGAIGDIVGGQCVRVSGEMRRWGPHERAPAWSDMEWQLRRWLFVNWLSGDFIVEMHVHNLDIINWALGSHPVRVFALGGRQARTGPLYGNIYDHCSAEFEYPGGVRIQYMGAQIDGASARNDQRLAGTRGGAYLDFGNARIDGDHPWEFDGESPNPEIRQHRDHFHAIRNGERLNEARRVAESTLTTIMGRMSAYTGRAVSWDWAMQASKLDLTPAQYEFGDLPLAPVPIPGVTPLV